MSQPPPLPPSSDDQRFAPPQDGVDAKNQRLQQLEQARKHLLDKCREQLQHDKQLNEPCAQPQEHLKAAIESAATVDSAGDTSGDTTVPKSEPATDTPASGQIQPLDEVVAATPAEQAASQAAPATQATSHKWLLWSSCMLSVLLAVACAVLLLDKFKPAMSGKEPGIDELQQQYQQKLSEFNQLNRQIIAQNRSELRLQHLAKLDETLSQSQANIAHIRQSIEKLKQQQQQSRTKIKLAAQDWVSKKQTAMRSQALGDLQLGNGRVLKGASIYRCYPEEVALHHEEGSLRVSVSELPEWVQRRCGYILPEELLAAMRGVGEITIETPAATPSPIPGGYEPPTAKPGLNVNPQAPGAAQPQPAPAATPEPPDSGLLPPLDPDLPEPS